MESLGTTLLPRCGRALLTVWLVVTVVFVILGSSCDPVRLLLPPEATPEQIEALRAELGLDKSMPEQYLRFWIELAGGDFGESLKFRQPALGLVLDRFPATAQLALAAFAISTVLGLAI